MKPTSYIINESTLYKHLEKMNLKPADSLQKLCSSILDQEARTEGVGTERVQISIDLNMLSESYIRVPGLFARSLPRRTFRKFPYIHSFGSGDYLVLQAGQSKVPTTFKARVLLALHKYGRFVCNVDDAPVAYRTRPAILSGVLTKELGRIVCNACKGSTIRWELAD